MPSNPLKPANAKAKRRAWHRQRSGSRSGRLSGIKSARSPEDTCATSYEFSSDCNLSYSYDANGRRTAIGDSYAQSDLPAAISTTTYNAANQLTKWGSATLSYDANGNLLSDGSLTHGWNARNQLASLSGGAVASFQYDALGRRIGKTVAGTATGFLYDGINPVQELTGSTPKANLLTGLGVDEIFSRTDASGARHLLTDALGSTLALTDGTGAVQTRYSYEPYGKTTVSGTASSNSFEYTGRENDNTGLYFYRARYYNPGLQRFVSEDPIGLAGGPNVYAYVGGNPVSRVDPTGKNWFPVIVVVGGGACYVIAKKLMSLYEAEQSTEKAVDQAVTARQMNQSLQEWAAKGAMGTPPSTEQQVQDATQAAVQDGAKALVDLGRAVPGTSLSPGGLPRH